MRRAFATWQLVVAALLSSAAVVSWGDRCVHAQGLSPSGERESPTGTSPRTTDRRTLERQVYQCFVAGNYSRAVSLITEHLKASPNDADMLYNLACAHCRLDEHDSAASALLRAFRAGFRDLEHLRTDPDLEALRDHPTYRRILEEADRSSVRSSREAFAHWREIHGEEHYRYASDDRRKINYAVALDESSFATIQSMLERQADQVNRSLFDGQTPGYFVLIAVPTPDDADQFFDGQDDIGGMYQHSMRRLVSRDIGASLRHEFFHALHYADMERTRQRHPLWVQEGLASLYEDYELSDDQGIRFVPNDRQPLVKARARAGRLIRWQSLFAMDGQTFMSRAQQHYPQVRSIFEFVADQGLLERWYKTYVRTFPDDPTSGKAFEEVFGKPLDDIERDWRRWVVEQPDIDLRIGAGDAALGIRSEDNQANDGVVIMEIVPGSTAARSRLRKGDVIVSVDGRLTTSMIDLRRIIAAKHVGDVIELKVRRDQEYLTLSVTLRPLSGTT